MHCITNEPHVIANNTTLLKLGIVLLYSIVTSTTFPGIIVENETSLTGVPAGKSVYRMKIVLSPELKM